MIIATTTVPNTDVTIAIEQQGRTYIITRTSAASDLVNYVQQKRETEEDARSLANWLWMKTRDARNAVAAGKPAPKPMMALWAPTMKRNAPARKTYTANPRVSDDQFSAVAVPGGKYALDYGNDEIKFFKVSHGKGSWLGKIFIEEQAGPNFHKVARPERRLEILTAIHADPNAAMTLYGQKKGHCGRCGLELTEKASRERGIGPICVAKLGW